MYRITFMDSDLDLISGFGSNKLKEVSLSPKIISTNVNIDGGSGVLESFSANKIIFEGIDIEYKVMNTRIDFYIESNISSSELISIFIELKNKLKFFIDNKNFKRMAVEKSFKRTGNKFLQLFGENLVYSGRISADDLNFMIGNISLNYVKSIVPQNDVFIELLDINTKSPKDVDFFIHNFKDVVGILDEFK